MRRRRGVGKKNPWTELLMSTQKRFAARGDYIKENADYPYLPDPRSACRTQENLWTIFPPRRPHS